jgi:hypothetical protein
MKRFKSISSDDIENYYKGNKYYGGVYDMWHLPRKIKDKFYILNIEPEGYIGGIHWCAVYNCGNECYYLDSFGVIASIPILKFMRTSNKDIYYNELAIQDLSSNLCGYYCIYVIDRLNENKQFVDIINKFSTSTKKNDNKLRNKIKRNRKSLVIKK